MGPYTSAVDLPRPRVELELGRRRHRHITGVSGLVLFVCLFLPAVKGCNEAVYPMTMPMLWHPYLYGLVLALASAKLTVRHLHYTVVALRVMAWFTIIGAAFLLVFASGIAFAELIVRVMLRGAIGLPGGSIGDDAVIGAASVVTRDVSAGAVVVGNPARAR
jgi:hypothetical protein